MSELITEFELGQLYAAVRSLQHQHAHTLDKTAASAKEFGITARSFASELLWYCEEYYRAKQRPF